MTIAKATQNIALRSREEEKAGGEVVSGLRNVLTSIRSAIRVVFDSITEISNGFY